MTTRRPSQPPEPPEHPDTIIFQTPPNQEAYIAALERALRDTALALASTGRRQTDLKERLAAIRKVLELPIAPAEALLEIQRIMEPTVS